MLQKEHKNILYVLFGVENQSHIHYAMPVRNMLYDVINYSAQVNEKTKQYRKERKKNPAFKETTEEFYLDGIKMTALFQLLLLLYILEMMNGMLQKAFKRCFQKQMNLFGNFFRIISFI